MEENQKKDNQNCHSNLFEFTPQKKRRESSPDPLIKTKKKHFLKKACQEDLLQTELKEYPSRVHKESIYSPIIDFRNDYKEKKFSFLKTSYKNKNFLRRVDFMADNSGCGCCLKRTSNQNKENKTQFDVFDNLKIVCRKENQFKFKIIKKQAPKTGNY